jgi:hypothetical protein
MESKYLNYKEIFDDVIAQTDIAVLLSFISVVTYIFYQILGKLFYQLNGNVCFNQNKTTNATLTCKVQCMNKSIATIIAS